MIHGFFVRLFATLLLITAPLPAPQDDKPELELFVNRIRWRTVGERRLIELRVVVTNRSNRRLFLEVCCGRDSGVDVLHNPGVEQRTKREITKDGAKEEWNYVGGAFTELPSPELLELEPGGQFESKIVLNDPYRMLSLPREIDLKPGYKVPIRGLHRISFRYFYSIAHKEAYFKNRETVIPRFVSWPFEIPEGKDNYVLHSFTVP